MKKTSLIITAIILVLTASWYFFIKDYDYKVTFKAKHAPGVVYNTLVSWNNWKPKAKKVVTNKAVKPFSEVSQQLNVSDSLIDIKWVIERQSDSTSKVSAYLTDTKHSFIQKLKVPFTKTNFVKRSISTVDKIRKGLKLHEKDYGVTAIEKATFPEQNIAFVTITTTLHEKAKKMMPNTLDVMQYIRNNELVLTGHPYLEVKSWNKSEDKITYDFCFPIAKQDNYPVNKKVKVKSTKKVEAIKTVFNGNYRISDRAWFTLIDYAENNNIAINALPIEVFLNDPHSGGNDLKWKAEVYMPIKNN